MPDHSDDCQCSIQLSHNFAGLCIAGWIAAFTHQVLVSESLASLDRLSGKNDFGFANRVKDNKFCTKFSAIAIF